MSRLMVWATFSDYYFVQERHSFSAWDPEFHRRDRSVARPDELIDIEQSAREHSLSEEVNEALNRLITHQVYQCLIAAELNKEFLIQQGFEILKSSGTSTVVRHRQYPEWLIKVGKENRYLPLESTLKQQQTANHGRYPIRNSNLLRAAGRDYLVRCLNGDDRFDIPEEYLYRSIHASDEAPHHQKYFAVSRWVEAYSDAETLEIIRGQNVETQRQIARLWIDFIHKTHFHDFHTSNITLSKDLQERWRFALLDTEPIGILIDQEDTGAHLFQAEEHPLLGLLFLRDRYCRHAGLTAMAEEVDRAIVDYQRDHSTITMRNDYYHDDRTAVTNFQIVRMVALIFFSIICPLIPLILLTGALLSTHRPPN